jgi:hypothetical protein
LQYNSGFQAHKQTNEKFSAEVFFFDIHQILRIFEIQIFENFFFINPRVNLRDIFLQKKKNIDILNFV